MQMKQTDQPPDAQKPRAAPRRANPQYMRWTQEERQLLQELVNKYEKQYLHPNWKEIATQFPTRSTRIVARQYALMKSKDGFFPKKKTVDDINKELYQRFLE